MLKTNDDHCVLCGDYVPEGRHVCVCCESVASKPKPADAGAEIVRSLWNLRDRFENPEHEVCGDAAVLIQGLVDSEQKASVDRGSDNCAHELKLFKEYFDGLYGLGLQVLNWHANGAAEPFDRFYDSAVEGMTRKRA